MEKKNLTLEEIRDEYRELFFKDISNVGLLCQAGAISCLIEDIEKVKDVELEQETNLTF